jgi:pilus assembly protein CpaB
LKAKLNRTWLLLAVAVLLAAAATWLTTQYLDMRTEAIRAELAAQVRAQPTATRRVIVPRRDLPAGTVISTDVVAAREVAADLVYDTAISAEQFEAIQGQALIRNVRQGRPLRTSDLRIVFADFSGYVPQGKRAMTVAINELDSNANMLQPGNWVDLMLVLGDGAATQSFVDVVGTVVSPFMSRMKVLATGQQVTSGGLPDGGNNSRRASYTNVTLEVTPEQAAKLTLAGEIGSLRAVLRNGEDSAQEQFAVVDQVNLLADIEDEVRRNQRARRRPQPANEVGAEAVAAPSPRTVVARAAADQPADRGPKVEYIIGGRGSGIAQSRQVDAPAPSPAAAMPDPQALIKTVQEQVSQQLERITGNAAPGNNTGSNQ